jgi:Fur family ferric uptake transcriptional regulator
MKLHDFRNELNKRDLKATPARVAVMKFLDSSEKPADVNTILKEFENKKIDVDPATVFRMMNLFVKKGIANQVSFQEGRTRYELSSRKDHHHLICENCGSTEDVADYFMKNFEKQISKKNSFLVKRHSLEFFGICKNCQS